MAPKTRIFLEAGIVGRVKNGTSSDIQKRRISQQKNSSSERGLRPYRGYRSLTPRRQEKVEAFLNQMSMKPADYADFGSDAWVDQLIAALGERQKAAIIPEDVHKWLAIHDNFFESIMMRINSAHPWLRDGGRPEASGGLREPTASISEGSSRNQSSASRKGADDNVLNESLVEDADNDEALRIGKEDPNRRPTADNKTLKTAVESEGRSTGTSAARISPAAANSNPEMGLNEAVKVELQDEALTCPTLDSQKAEVVIDKSEDIAGVRAFVASATGSTDCPVIEIGENNTFKITGSFNGPLFMEVVAALHTKGLLPTMESIILTPDEGCLEGLESIPPSADPAARHVGSEVANSQMEVISTEAFRMDVVRMLGQIEQLKVQEPGINWNVRFHALKILEDLTAVEENVAKGNAVTGNQ